MRIPPSASASALRHTRPSAFTRPGASTAPGKPQSTPGSIDAITAALNGSKRGDIGEMGAADPANEFLHVRGAGPDPDAADDSDVGDTA